MTWELEWYHQVSSKEKKTVRPFHHYTDWKELHQNFYSSHSKPNDFIIINKYWDVLKGVLFLIAQTKYFYWPWHCSGDSLELWHQSPPAPIPCLQVMTTFYKALQLTLNTPPHDSKMNCTWRHYYNELNCNVSNLFLNKAITETNEFLSVLR